MAKNHMTMLAAPNTWVIKRKSIGFITKQDPGPHSLELSIPLNILLKEMLRYAKNTSESVILLNSNKVMIDCTRRKKPSFPVGIFDTVAFADTNEHFRMTLTKKGKLAPVKISKEESSIKPAKIIGKTMVNGKLQLNLYDGKNIFASGSFKVGDTVFISLPDQKIMNHLKLEKKSTIFLIGGKHTGEVGIVEDIDKNKIIYKNSHGNLIETLKKYAFVVGDLKPLVTIG